MAFALLGKLLDIEWLLRRDEQRSSAELMREDRALLGPAVPASPEQALELWLSARRREHGGRTVGARASELLTALHLTFVGLALLAGMGTAKALLHGPSAREPSNVLTFLFATLIAPLALLAGSLCLLALRGRFARSILIEDLYLLGLGVLARLSGRASHGADAIGADRLRADEIVAHWRALRRSARRYRDLEVATLLSAAQWYPIGFHLGAALALTGSALFSDLSFAWSTTNDSLQPATLAALFRVVAAPWCDTLAVGCVSPELVRATQFSHFTQQYSLPGGVALSGGWWPALLGCLLLYGVVPRLAFALALQLRVWRRSARLADGLLELRGRLHGLTVRVSETQPEPASSAPAALAASPARPAEVLPCWVVEWRGAALGESELGQLCARLRLHVARRDAAGDGDFERDEALLGGGDRSPLSAVLLLVDGWEAPDKATRHFIEALRRRGDRPVFVAVLLDQEDAPALAIWRERLRSLGDPGVSLEAVVARSRQGSAEARA